MITYVIARRVLLKDSADMLSQLVDRLNLNKKVANEWRIKLASFGLLHFRVAL